MDHPAQRLRDDLAHCLDALDRGDCTVRVAPAGVIDSRGDGHFHLTPELFLQVGGSTRFRFPHGSLTLAPGEALLLPPQLLHAERVRRGERGEAFRNLVVRAEGEVLNCHLAHEAAPGQAAILHLEARLGPPAIRIHDWLADAARLAPDFAAAATPAARHRATVQARALVTAATAGVLRALDDSASGPTLCQAANEPPLVARLRVLVQNRLGDASLSVRGLAHESGCTPDYLSNLFSRSTGEHLVAHVNRLRMERAARLLRETTMAGKEVAWACGYASASYFTRSFRAHHGVTPKAFRLRQDAGRMLPAP